MDGYIHGGNVKRNQEEVCFDIHTKKKRKL